MDLLLQACGASRPLQLHLEGPGIAGVECRTFDTPYVVIGRDPASDLVLEHREVCARHAYLQLYGGRLHCVDLGSRSGTSLGGQSRRAGWVGPQQVVRIGPYRIRLVAGVGDGDGQGPEDLDLPRLTLDLSHRGFKASECPIAGGLSLVGSATDCAVRLVDPGISNVHCSLLYTSLGVWVVDLFGRGGIEVNGHPVRHTMLREADVLRIGRSSIRIRHAAEADASGRTDPSPRHEEWTHVAAIPVAAPARAMFGLADGPGHPEEHDTASSWMSSPSGPETEPDPEWESPAPALRPSYRKRQMEDAELADISAKERRGSCRYPVDNVDAVLSWWEPIACPAVVVSERDDPKVPPAEETMYSRVMARWPGSRNGTPSSRATAELSRDPLPPVEESMRPCVSGARLLDISQTGLLVLSEAVPPADQRIWLRLEGSRITDWVEVVLKGATPGARGANRVRLAFREACPYDFFKAVVYNKSGS